MKDLLSWILIFLLFGCEMKLAYQIDGVNHEIVLNPQDKPGVEKQP